MVFGQIYSLVGFLIEQVNKRLFRMGWGFYYFGEGNYMKGGEGRGLRIGLISIND